MGHTLRIEIADHLYDMLQSRARQRGITLEQIVAECLGGEPGALGADPLLELAGVVDSSLGDLAEHHDCYIGQSLAEKVTRRGGT